MSDVKTHLRNCNICEAMCGLEIQYQGTEILSIKGDKQDPFSKGHICPKAVALQDFYTDKERLKTPIKRASDGSWHDISWEEAFDEVAEQFRKIQSAYGADALGIYLGNPNAHNLGNGLFLPQFIRSLGTKNRYSSASTDQMPHHVASNYMFGAGMLIPIPDIDRTDFMLIIGANPVVSNGSMMTAPNVLKRLKAIQARGGKVVVVDPRRTETADMADEHLFIRPEKDALLLMAMINTLISERLVSLGHLGKMVEGVEKVIEAAVEFTPEAVQMAVGISSEKIKQLTREMASANSAVCYSRMGASVQSFGGLCQWLTNVFNILNGNFDREGGAMFTQPAFDALRTLPKGKKSSYGRYQSRVRKLPFFNGEFPVATLADEILTAGPDQIRALITIAGNPVLSSPSGDKLAKAFDSLDFMVSVDIYLNETTKHANIILPATTGLEIPHFDIFFNSFAVRNTAKYSPPLFEKSPHQRHDWEILNELMTRVTGTTNDATPESILDSELRKGFYGDEGMSIEMLLDNPHGVDLGPLKPCLETRIKTVDGVICLAPELYLSDIPRLRDALDAENNDAFPFELIGRRLVRSHNTWTQNSRRLVKGKNPCTLVIHPEDAESLAVHHGDMLRVRSDKGEVKIEAAVSDEVLQGVVSMPQGWGHNQRNTRMSTAAGQPGVSINDLTDVNRIDKLTGNAALNGTRVAIELVE